MTNLKPAAVKNEIPIRLRASGWLRTALCLTTDSHRLGRSPAAKVSALLVGGALLAGSLPSLSTRNLDPGAPLSPGNAVVTGGPTMALDPANRAHAVIAGTKSQDGFEPGETVVHGPKGLLLHRRAFRGELPKMIQRYVTDVGPPEQNFGAFEPTSGFGPDGTAFYISGGDGEDLKPRVLRSFDDGVTWHNVSPRFVPNQIPRVSGVDESPPITGDPFLHVDPLTGRVFSYNQQAFLFCDNWDVSKDGGETWDSRHTCDDEHSFGDHPSITTGPPRASTTTDYPNVVYFCAAGEASFCRTSLDGGKSFGEPVEAMSKGEPQTGHVATGPDGIVYLPHVGEHAAWVAMSQNDGRTWKTVMVDDTVWTGPNRFNSPNPDFPENNHDASVAVDEDGNAYFFWLGDDSLPYLSVSRDTGETWSRPVRVEAPGVTAANFQEIVAGRRGQIAFLYIGTTVPSGFHAEPEAYANATWNAYVGFSLNALSAHPVFATATANPPSDPLRRGDCAHRCWVDRGLTGRGELRDSIGDFLDIDVNPATGDVWVSLVDLCNDQCGGREAVVSENDGEFAMAAVGVQIEGARIGPREGLRWR